MRDEEISFVFFTFIYWEQSRKEEAHTCNSVYGKVRGQLAGVCSLFSLYGFKELNHQATLLSEQH